jgi:TetR/AcrR family transcriptional repressor of nem operon
MSTDADDGLPVVATLVGVILLARATAGTEPSEKILESTHKVLTAPHGPRPESQEQGLCDGDSTPRR